MNSFGIFIPTFTHSPIHPFHIVHMSRILLLEDDPILSREVTTFLTTTGFVCDGVFDGDVFFRQLGLADYDVFLLDINVPGMNGLEVCRKVRTTIPRRPS